QAQGPKPADSLAPEVPFDTPSAARPAELVRRDAVEPVETAVASSATRRPLLPSVSPRADEPGETPSGLDPASPLQLNPQSLALDRAAQGTAGSGAADNFDSQLPADAAAQRASASAQRPRPVQATDPGPDLSPMAAAEIPHRVAQAPAPVAALAETMESAEQFSSPAARDIPLSASATTETRASNAEASTVTAARGELDVDFGPSRLAGDVALGRSS